MPHHELERPPKHVPIAVGAVALATVVFVAWIARHAGERSAVFVSDAAQLAAAAIAAGCCFAAGTTRPTRRRFWWLLGASCAAWASGQVVWTGYDLAGADGPPIPSWADVGFLSFIPLAVSALLFHPGLRGGGARSARLVLDGLGIATALLFLSWMFLLGPLWQSSDVTTLGGIVTLAYPCGDVVLGFGVVLAVRRMTATGRTELWFLLAGLIALAVSDSAYAYVVQIEHYASGDVLDTGWVAGFLAIALGALSADPRDLPARSQSEEPWLASLVAPLIPMFVALASAAVVIHRGGRPDRVALAMALALVALALLRQALLVVDFLVAGGGGSPASTADRLAYAAFGAEVERWTGESGAPRNGP